jgi:hypothetical protein
MEVACSHHHNHNFKLRYIIVIISINEYFVFFTLPSLRNCNETAKVKIKNWTIARDSNQARWFLRGNWKVSREISDSFWRFFKSQEHFYMKKDKYSSRDIENPLNFPPSTLKHSKNRNHKWLQCHELHANSVWNKFLFLQI